jgi:pimeloyl-ACP methyl ester carboxylesterase
VPDEQLRQVWADLDIACAMFYGDCDEPTTKAALDRLRPQSAYPAILPCSLAEFPAVETTYVVCSDDQILRPEWSRRTAERLGAELIELPGDHSPFYSRPEALAEVLLRLAS